MTIIQGKLYDFTEDIINSSSTDGGGYANYKQLYTQEKRRKREILNASSSNKMFNNIFIIINLNDKSLILNL